MKPHQAYRRDSFQAHYPELLGEKLTPTGPLCRSVLMRIVVLAVAALFAAWPAVADQSRISVQVSAKEIVVSNVSPGADVYLLGCLQEGRDFYTTLLAVDLTASDDDRDGVVTFAYPKGVPLRSVWIGMDERSGDIGVGVPSGYTLRMTSIPPGAWKKRKGSAIDAIAIEHKALEYLFVHPGQGVWRWGADQGSKRDEDGVDDNILTVSPGSMRPAKNGKSATPSPDAPQAFSAGEVVVAIDPFTLEVITSRVSQ